MEEKGEKGSVGTVGHIQSCMLVYRGMKLAVLRLLPIQIGKALRRACLNKKCVTSPPDGGRSNLAFGGGQGSWKVKERWEKMEVDRTHMH